MHTYIYINIDIRNVKTKFSHPRAQTLYICQYFAISVFRDCITSVHKLLIYQINICARNIIERAIDLILSGRHKGEITVEPARICSVAGQ
jgi:hypothetical protein